jgi:hypothetical protein
MAGDSQFAVEDFLEAITAQLDRTQDALRMKAVNRPLTYAIRDFSIELKVFVDLGADGKVYFRPSASGDSGASSVSIGFTTVNRTMIDENTVSLAATKSPTLEELGLDDDERRRLERLGVRNAAQLEQLGRMTSDDTVARFSGLPVNRLRQAMAQGQPAVQTVEPVVGEPAVAAPPVMLPRGTRRVRLGGPRLAEAAAGATLHGRALSVQPVEGGVEVLLDDTGDDPEDGELRLDLGPHGTLGVALQFERDGVDPWRPQ